MNRNNPILKMIFYALACSPAILTGNSSNLPTPSTLNWLAYGDLRGYIEPCGCDPSTDLGGVVRLANFITEQKKIFPETLTFDLGNNIAKANKIKNKFINESLDSLKPDAALINEMELKEKTYMHSSRNFILSNANIHLKVTPFAVSNNAVIFGYLDKNIDKENLLGLDHKLIQRWKKILKKFPNKKRILLINASDKQILEIADQKMFDTIISSNANPLKALIGNEEISKPGLLLRIRSPQAIYQVPLGGQGVLLGGALRKGDTSLIDKVELEWKDDITKEKTRKKSSNIKEINQRWNNESIVQWLTGKYQVPGIASRLMKRYNLELKKEFERSSANRLATLKNSPFIGAQACKSCHLKEWNIWQKTQHAHSYKTLVTKNKEKDPECISCHVLAYNLDGGFVSKENSPNFASVQCENCHGPRKEHTQNPTAKIKTKQAAKEVCKNCHHKPHSTKFLFQSYWEK
ncbi:MAG: multiheme c-type cytochrome [Bdellovibrionota bacterium]